MNAQVGTSYAVPATPQSKALQAFERQERQRLVAEGQQWRWQLQQRLSSGRSDSAAQSPFGSPDA